jgi:hypothetical protein
MLKITCRFLATVVLSVLVLLAGVVGAEAGTPISSCGATLTEPGTYVLTANVTTAGATCITVAADSVTIDLNGFEISRSGPPGPSTGIADSGGHKATAVRNGTITGFFPFGINLGGGTGSLVDSVILFGTGEPVVVGAGSTVRNSTIHDNNSGIVFVGGAGFVRNNTIYKSVTVGVSAGGHAHMTVTGNTIAQHDFDGIRVGDHSTVTDNVVLGNGVSAGANAITGGSHTVVNGNTVLDNTVGFGITVGDHSTVNDNVVNNNTVTVAGIDVGDHSIVLRNTALNNSADGIDIACPSTVKFNTALGNTGTNLKETGSGCTNVGNNAP